MQPDWVDFYLFLSLLILFTYILMASSITTLHKAYLAFHSMMMMWPFFHFFISIAPDRQFQWYFLNAAFVGLCFLGYGWLVFSMVLTKKFDSLRRPVLYLLAVPAFICSVLVTTNPWHLLFAQSYNNGWAVRIYGPFFWLFVLSSLAYLIAATVMMMQTMKTVGESNLKRQLALCLRGVLLLLGFSLSDMLVNVVLFPRFGVVPGLTSLGIIISAVCFAIAIRKHDLFRIVNIAQQEVIDSMSTGMVVLDNDEIVLGCNKSASRFLRVQPGRVFNVEDLFSPGGGESLSGGFIKEYRENKLKSLRAETILRGARTWHVSISVSPVLDGKKNLLGRIVTLHDVTELRGLLDKINENNAVLQKRNNDLMRVQEELYDANQKLEKMAVTDHLTGCYNKRYLLRQMVYEISVARRYSVPFSIMLLDIDRFKLINDTYGHLAGDSVLRGVVEALKKNLRSSDILARFGGEEFIIYLPHTGSGRGLVFAERIRASVESQSFSISGQALRVTVSIGLVSVDAGDSPDGSPESVLEDLLASADRALYKAKAKGRNCVVAADVSGAGEGKAAAFPKQPE